MRIQSQNEGCLYIQSFVHGAEGINRMLPGDDAVKKYHPGDTHRYGLHIRAKSCAMVAGTSES
jgi:hypothetical protein